MLSSFMLMQVGCSGSIDNETQAVASEKDSAKMVTTAIIDTVNVSDTIKKKHNEVVLHQEAVPAAQVSAGQVPVDSIINFAKSLIGTPYLYASIDPAKGFDCSGFITYVYSHFHIKVPRSSIDFTNVGEEIPLPESKKGDLILFTGTDSTERFVGHMGIIISNSDSTIEFIHSSSGKAHGVVITPLNAYYKGRFMKVVRI